MYLIQYACGTCGFLDFVVASFEVGIIGMRVGNGICNLPPCEMRGADGITPSAPRIQSGFFPIPFTSGWSQE
ncbi:hypothetical protein BLA_1462 [Bifidobacterium animalis subsp. lactis AD011]|uniref:Uncharacterized protein n=1 Tax=Bifidobacterium animalis subsp. lactis (strain AD011) TaxID=442563 RepID=B8DUR6_BIFA0|nr:hypothetical protein BLA_1462 [Bifidobacterium animalis subsp. lactis AD011]